MKSDFLNAIFNNNYEVQALDENNRKYRYYIRAKEELDSLGINSYSLDRVLEFIRDSNNYLLFQNSINDIKEELLYVSFGHGKYHNERTFLFAYMIATKEGLSIDDTRLVLDAAKYHDIGRENDYEDREHGKRSANMIDFLKDDYSAENMNILKAIITGHSIDDEEFDMVTKEYDVKDIGKCKRLYDVLKDADGLDRVRLGNPHVGLEYLRTATSKRLVLSSYELYYNFELIYYDDYARVKGM